MRLFIYFISSSYAALPLSAVRRAAEDLAQRYIKFQFGIVFSKGLLYNILPADGAFICPERGLRFALLRQAET